jgi:hypothetical protein
MRPATSVSVPPEQLVHAMMLICEHEGFEPAEAAGVAVAALTWPPEQPRDPEPLRQRCRLPV